MSTLVRVPYQPGYYCTPDTLALLLKACELAGHNIPISDAWRSYAEQSYYYQLSLHGGPPASDPDTGQRNHMRAAAFDIVNQSDRQYMLAAGFTPDGVEWWHFNNPNWRNMPIIPDATGLASLNAQPLGGFLMALSDSEQAEILNGMRQVFAAVFTGGTSMKDGNKSISLSLAEIHNLAQQLSNATFVGGPSMKDGTKSVSQSLAEIHAELGAFKETVSALAAGKGLDPAAIRAQAQAGAEAALAKLSLTLTK